MLVFLAIISMGLLGLIVYFAVSPKSSRLLRLTAIIALGAICLSLAVCGIIIFIGPAEDQTANPLSLFSDITAPAEKKGNILEIIVIVALMIALGLVIAKAYRDQQKQAGKAKKAAKSPAFPGGDELDDLEMNAPKKDEEFDDSFDLGLE